MGLTYCFCFKKDGTSRICVANCHKLRAVTIWESYPIPCMDDCIDSLSDTTIFSTLDANTRYWEVEIADEYCD